MLVCEGGNDGATINTKEPGFQKDSLVSNIYTKNILLGKTWFGNDIRKYWWDGNEEMTVQPLTQRSLHTLVHLLSYLALSKEGKIIQRN